jgi:quinol monooxygenase YgiN
MREPTILVRARFVVGADRREEFERIIAQLTLSSEGEPGTLTFRFFRGAPGEYAVIEEYADAAAAIAHQTANQDLLARAAMCTEGVSMDLHGPVGPVLREWAQGDPSVTLYEDSVPPSEF